MNFVTYFDRDRSWFSVLVATGPGTKPTPDGGPWACEYTVPPNQRHRLATISRNAENMLAIMLRDHAPAVHEEAIRRGWFDDTFGAPRPQCRERARK